MKRAILYVHGKSGSAGEADRFRAVCPGFDVLGVDYRGGASLGGDAPDRGRL